MAVIQEIVSKAAYIGEGVQNRPRFFALSYLLNVLYVDIIQP